MLVSELKITDSKPLRASDSIEHGYKTMLSDSVNYMAVIDFTTGRLLGEVLLKDLLESPSPDASVLSVISKKPTVVSPGMHILDLASWMDLNKYDHVYITDAHNAYSGTITENDLNKAIASLLNTKSSGSVIRVDIHERDYSLMDLMRVIELENAKIFGMGVQMPNESNPFFRVSLKLNTTEIEKIVLILNRYGYTITSKTETDETDNDLYEKADEFMRYLGI